MQYLKIDMYSLMWKNEIELCMEKKVVSIYEKERLAVDNFNFLLFSKENKFAIYIHVTF